MSTAWDDIEIPLSPEERLAQRGFFRPLPRKHEMPIRGVG